MSNSRPLPYTHHSILARGDDISAIGRPAHRTYTCRVFAVDIEGGAGGGIPDLRCIIVTGGRDMSTRPVNGGDGAAMLCVLDVWDRAVKIPCLGRAIIAARNHLRIVGRPGYSPYGSAMTAIAVYHTPIAEADNESLAVIAARYNILAAAARPGNAAHSAAVIVAKVRVFAHGIPYLHAHIASGGGDGGAIGRPCDSID